MIASARIALLLVMAWPILGADTLTGPLAKAALALRVDVGKVLIVGDAIDNPQLPAVSTIQEKKPPTVSITAALLPAEAIFQITREQLDALVPKPATRLELGTRWQLYPGAGSPVAITIEKLLLLTAGDGTPRVGALARIVDRDDANRVAGLRASEYLVIPGTIVAGISQVPFMPLPYTSADVNRLLFERGQKLVHDDNWETVGNPGESRRSRAMNHAFLEWPDPQTRESRSWVWNPGGRKPLLFVESVWIDEDHKLPLFAVNAVVQDGAPLQVLNFNERNARWMRMSEFLDRDWRLGPGDEPFRNAWKIGADCFVLTYSAGYEGFSVDLERLDSKDGLVPVLSFGN